MSHYIRTIHTDYTARAAPSSSHTPLILNLGSYRPHPAAKCPPGLASPTDWRSPYGAPAPVPVHALSSGAQQPAYTRRTRRTPGLAYRRAPPPPPRTSYAYNMNTNMKFDPFSDELGEYDVPPPSSVSPVLYRTPPTTTTSSRLTPASLVLSTPSPRPKSLSPSPSPSHSPLTLAAPVPHAPAPAPIDPNARSRLVAGILLNRVHAVGRPMRRRSFEGPREYVKSGLSCVVSVEA